MSRIANRILLLVATLSIALLAILTIGGRAAASNGASSRWEYSSVCVHAFSQDPQDVYSFYSCKDDQGELAAQHIIDCTAFAAPGQDGDPFNRNAALNGCALAGLNALGADDWEVTVVPERDPNYVNEVIPYGRVFMIRRAK